MTTSHDPPIPDLRILCTEQLLPHEEHDPQRLSPLIQRIANAAQMINPVLVVSQEVAPRFMGQIEGNEEGGQFVILDGANRWRAFKELGYSHILVQVLDGQKGQIRLESWHHVLAGVERQGLLQALEAIPQLELEEGERAHALAHIVFRDRSILALCSPLEAIKERNATLREIVRGYQAVAHLYRTAIVEPDEVWAQFPEALALVHFPHIYPEEIQRAAAMGSFLPPGVSRHIIPGRAIRVNYPLQLLLDEELSSAQKNANLQFWIREKLKRRQLRFYAEATYQFDE